MKLYKTLLVFSLIIITALGLIGCLGEEGGGGSTPEDAYYNITTSVESGSGTITLTPDQSEYQNGTVVTIEADPDTNFLFDHWDGSLNGSQKEQTITVEQNMSILAYFVEGITNTDITTNITSDNLTAGEFPVTLTGSINDPNGDISEVIINWGDGTSDTISSNYDNIDIDHTYAQQKSYTIIITAINPEGEDIETEKEVNVTVITFVDENLEQVVRDKIDKQTQEITIHDVKDINQLNCHDANISALGGIEYLTNLTNLQLNENNISDISLLSNLINLEFLSLTKTDVTDISPVAGLTNLKKLSFNYTDVTNLSVLSNLTKLEELYATKQHWYSGITDISPLSNLTNLTDLDLNRSDLEDISPLSNLTNLENLTLSENNISDLTPLSGSTNLNVLNLNYNEITDISPLENLTNLSFLDLENNLLDTSSGSEAMSVITHLENNGVNVDY